MSILTKLEEKAPLMSDACGNRILEARSISYSREFNNALMDLAYAIKELVSRDEDLYDVDLIDKMLVSLLTSKADGSEVRQAIKEINATIADIDRLASRREERRKIVPKYTLGDGAMLNMLCRIPQMFNLGANKDFVDNVKRTAEAFSHRAKPKTSHQQKRDCKEFIELMTDLMNCLLDGHLEGANHRLDDFRNIVIRDLSRGRTNEPGMTMQEAQQSRSNPKVKFVKVNMDNPVLQPAFGEPTNLVHPDKDNVTGPLYGNGPTAVPLLPNMDKFFDDIVLMKPSSKVLKESVKRLYTAYNTNIMQCNNAGKADVTLSNYLVSYITEAITKGALDEYQLAELIDTEAGKIMDAAIEHHHKRTGQFIEGSVGETLNNDMLVSTRLYKDKFCKPYDREEPYKTPIKYGKYSY